MASSVSDYHFNSTARIGSDSCALDQRTLQNTSLANYHMQRFTMPDANAVQFATSYVGVNYSGHPIDEKVIDTNSRMFLSKDQLSQQLGPLEHETRPYLSVPYLGRGTVNTNMETYLRNGAQHTSRRDLPQTSESSMRKYNTTPLIPDVKKHIQNPTHIIESSWVRGGMSSRDMHRDA